VSDTPSLRPLAQKLGYTPGTRARLDGAPTPYPALAAGMPDGVVFLEDPDEEADLVHLFVMEETALRPALAAHLDRLAPRGALWVSWPKKSARTATTVTEDTIRDAALPMGLVDVKVCAVDATWSALKLVRRLSGH